MSTNRPLEYRCTWPLFDEAPCNLQANEQPSSPGTLQGSVCPLTTFFCLTDFPSRRGLLFRICKPCLLYWMSILFSRLQSTLKKDQDSFFISCPLILLRASFLSSVILGPHHVVWCVHWRYSTRLMLKAYLKSHTGFCSLSVDRYQSS
jgi:hypothetical protein